MAQKKSAPATLASSATAYDLVIVGAGVSGLFSAWRLLAKQPKLRILFLEKLARTGGRLQTTTVPITGADGKVYSVKDEEGGMRFNNGMPHLGKLVGDLKLTPVPFLMELPATSVQHYYFRGHAFTSADTPGIWSQLYDLADSESNQSPGTVIETVMNAVLAQNPRHTFPGGLPAGATEWQTFRNECTFNGLTINQWGFWALLRTCGLTEECIDWLETAIGFMGPTQQLINAGESLQIILDFPNSPDFNTLDKGFGSIPSTLEALLRKSPNVTFHLGESVSHIAEAPGGGVQVFTDELIGGHYTAAQILFAIPREGLARIIAGSTLLQGNRGFGEAVESVQDMFLAKIGLYFDQRWWHGGAVNLTCGPSFTDLPLGSVYCFQQFPLTQDAKKDAAYTGPAALTVYTDYDRANFWMEMQNLGPMYIGALTQPPNTEPASAALVAEAMRQIRLLFNVPPWTAVPDPVLATFRVWGHGQYGYGYHQYKLNVNDVTDVDPKIWNPLPGIFVCNESWSPEQGWVEGALIAADHVLTSGFGLAPYVKVP